MKQTTPDTPAIKPALRVDSVEEYYFARRLREVAALKAEGRDIISLAIGGPDLPPPSDAIATLCRQASLPDSHSYQPANGLPELRQAFARWYDRHYGVKLDPDSELQPLIGSKEAVMLLSLTFLNPGDKVLVPDPGYPTYTSASRLAGAEVINYDLTEENHWLPDLDALDASDLSGVKMMWVNYPHMPTGAQASEELFRRICDFGRRHSIVIVNDNPYSFILNDRPLSILSVPGAKDICIELNSLSKSHNMAGWRMAMMASNSQFIGWARKVKSNIDSGQFRPAMLAAVEALNAPQSWYDSLNDTYKRRQTIAKQIMNALNCTFDPHQRGLFLWGRIPDNEPSGQALADRLLYDLDIFIAPGFIFGHNGDRYIRLSLCANENQLQRALHRITKQTTNT